MSQNDVPVRGMPLRWRLGLITCAIVTLVLGTLTFVVQKRELERSRADREALLGQAAAPLAADIEAAVDAAGITARLRSFQNAHVSRGFEHVHALLRDAKGNSQGASEEPGPEALRARIPVKTGLLEGGHGTLEVWQDGQQFRALIERRWRLWLLTFALAIVSILLSLSIAYQRLIDRPLRRLLEGVHQMEMGYWSGLQLPRGAWELRWLAYRFRNLGSQLEETVRHLVEAERRALLGLSTSAPADGRPAPAAGTPAGATRDETVFRRRLLRRYLVSRCRYLEARGPRDSGAVAAARETWEHDVLEAERLGEGRLKSRLEDAALRILEPETFAGIVQQISALSYTQKPWLRLREAEIRKVLGQAKTKPRALQHRVKHPAGILRKMRSKGLALEQIHDIVAFRIVVPTEQSCYDVLHAVHERFEPLLLRFKDYIAHPKKNGYRSLHTCVKAPDGVIFEIQIRTPEMHDQAEGGTAAHWRYKASPGRPVPEPAKRRAFDTHRPVPAEPKLVTQGVRPDNLLP